MSTSPRTFRRNSARSSPIATGGALRVLGVDPGLTRCGVGVIDVAPNRTAIYRHAGVIRTDTDAPVAQRLHAIARGIDALLDEYAPDAVAVERVFAQHNVRTVMGTAQAAGVALERAAARGLPVGLHTPSEVKAAVTGFGGADKRQVTTMVTRILKLDAPPRPADAADALALALCHAWRQTGTPSSGSAADATAPPAAALTPAQRAWAEAERRSRPAR